MEITKLSDVMWEIPKSGQMKVPARIFASRKMLDKMMSDMTIQQCQNVAALPGIYKQSIVMPDGHQGYMFTRPV
jgi:tRNA-splicing ligase RtcB